MCETALKGFKFHSGHFYSVKTLKISFIQLPHKKTFKKVLNRTKCVLGVAERTQIDQFAKLVDAYTLHTVNVYFFLNSKFT